MNNYYVIIIYDLFFVEDYDLSYRYWVIVRNGEYI